MRRERAFYEAIRRAVAAVGADITLKQAVDAIVRGTARAMRAGASLVLLDGTRSKLIHQSSWGLPETYLRKGILDAQKSLAEVISGRPVAVADVLRDNRVQYPKMAARAAIASILGVPVTVNGETVGSIRVYARQPTEFNEDEVNFVTAMASLVSMALGRERSHQPEATTREGQAGEAGTSLPRQYRTTTFAHPSEAEFARILDFYAIEWVYEPRSFPLEGEGDRITEMFTPDFYLPRLDLYVELTTLKQSLVTEKNRKLRRLRELYPEVKISLLYKKDFDRLLAKYGFGPLAQARSHGISRVLYSSAEIEQKVHDLAQQVSRDYAGRRPLMVGVLRGVFCFMADLTRQMTIPLDVDFMSISYYTGGSAATVKITKDMDLNVADRHVIMVEDIVDTGMTLSYMLNHIRAREPASLAVCALLDKRVRRIVNVPINYTGFEVPDEFVVGYGLDYGEEYRNLPFISILRPEGKSEVESNDGTGGGLR